MASSSSKKASRQTATTKSSALSRDGLLGAALVLAVVLVYTPMIWAGYVWDDAFVVTANPVIVGPQGLWEIWTTGAADICPLTITAFWFEYKSWGAAPFPYHLVNVLEHAASAVLLWQVLSRLRIPGAWLGAALWALHPVVVESVAWISEMKNTQSGLFYLLTIFFFLRVLDDGTNKKRDYALTLLFAAMAMASKSSTVILPLVLGLVAWWKEGRWPSRHLAKLIPMFAMSLAAAAVSIGTQRMWLGQPNPTYPAATWPERIATAGYDVWFYLAKLAWPHPLITFYPRFAIDPSSPVSWFPSCAVVAAIAFLWCKHKGWARPWFFTFAYFLAALLPVLGIVDNTIFHYAPVFDHLQYLAAMGPLALAGAGLSRLREVMPDARRWMTPTLVGALLVLLGLTSWLQAWAYENEEVLWTYTLAWNPTSAAAHYDLGNVLIHDGRPQEAITQFRTSLALNPNNPIVHNNLARALAGLDQSDEARAEMKIALQQAPDDSTMHDNYGSLLLKNHQVDAAIAEFHHAANLDPHDADAHFELGVAFAQKEQFDDSIAEFQNAIDLKPGDAEAHNDLGVELLHQGRVQEAIREFQKALRLNPDSTAAQANLTRAQDQAAAGAK